LFRCLWGDLYISICAWGTWAALCLRSGKSPRASLSISSCCCPKAKHDFFSMSGWSMYNTVFGETQPLDSYEEGAERRVKLCLKAKKSSEVKWTSLTPCLPKDSTPSGCLWLLTLLNKGLWAGEKDAGLSSGRASLYRLFTYAQTIKNISSDRHHRTYQLFLRLLQLLLLPVYSLIKMYELPSLLIKKGYPY